MSETPPMIGFVHIAKTAGTSVKFVLRNSFGLGHCNLLTVSGGRACGDVDLAFARSVFFGLRSISGHALVDPTRNLSAPIRYFTFLRDPVKRYASHYQQRVRYSEREGKLLAFDEYLADKTTWNRQVRKLAGAFDLERAQEALVQRFFLVGLVERFDESLTALGRLSPHPLDLRYPRLKVGAAHGEKDRVLSDPGMRRQIEQANQLDLELYAFARETLSEPQLREAASLPGQRARECTRVPGAWRYWLNRWYTLGVYRNLAKRRRRSLARTRQTGAAAG